MVSLPDHDSVSWLLRCLCVTCRDDTSGEDAEDKEPTVAVKGRRTANSQGRRKGRITRSMTSEVEEAAAPPVNNELGSSQSHYKKWLLFSSEIRVAHAALQTWLKQLKDSVCKIWFDFWNDPIWISDINLISAKKKRLSDYIRHLKSPI